MEDLRSKLEEHKLQVKTEIMREHVTMTYCDNGLTYCDGENDDGEVVMLMR